MDIDDCINKYGHPETWLEMGEEKYHILEGSKSRWYDHAEEILSGEVVIPQEDQYLLLVWFQDMNWPGAREISEYLSPHLHEFIDPILLVLEVMGDPMWHYWLIHILENLSAAECGVLVPTLLKLANINDVEYVHFEAIRLLASKRLIDAAQINQMLRHYIRANASVQEMQSDYQEIIQENPWLNFTSS